MPIILGAAFIALAILASGRKVAAAIPQQVHQEPGDLYGCGLSCGDVAPGAVSGGARPPSAAPSQVATKPPAPLAPLPPHIAPLPARPVARPIRALPARSTPRPHFGTFQGI